jgi:acylphosphatase
MPTVHLLIKGKVQGVFYRASAKEVAMALDLRGWVKNTREGHVEAMASGSESALQQFIEWCNKGPAGARVTSLAVVSVPDTAFEDFKIDRTS